MNFQCSRTNKRINCLVYVKAFDRIIMKNISDRVFEVFISAVNITTCLPGYVEIQLFFLFTR